jgi:phosphate starvation-inducible PhoH-like protein
VPRRNAKLAKRANRENPRIDRPTPILHPQEPRIKRVELLPRNLAQENYIAALQDEANHIVFAIGPAGCGKSLLCTQYAIQQLQQRAIERIVITRPAVGNGEDLGALPGTLIEKMAPWTRPLIDIFREYYPVRTITRMLEEEIIEICPLSYMRGRTMKNACMIFDEAQNSLPSQMKMCLTRIGDGTRLFVTGDLMQYDRGYDDNGLQDFIARLERDHSAGIAVCRFDSGDVERHPIIEDVLRIYGQVSFDRRRWNGSGLAATAD